MKLLETGLTLDAPKIDKAQEELLCTECNISSLTARVLLARGISSSSDVKRFLSPSLDRDLNDPACIPGLLQVADYLEQAINAKKKIVVFGDFDVDGVTATTVSVRGLRALGAQAQGLIPHRYDEGYALSEAAIQRALLLEPDVIMTVDCGISCKEEVKSLLERNIDVLITDHHEPSDNLPQDVPIADPKLEADNISGDLAGVGVALKLIQVLGQRLGQPDLWRSLTEFAALGTIADLMNLNYENRAIVADGINRMRNSARPCLLQLAQVCGVALQEITSTKLSFSLIPRLNAAGRMGDASQAFDLLMADDIETAAKAAKALEKINDERREAEATLLKQVEEELTNNYHGEEAIIIAGSGWHEGVKGIVASRIARKYHRPTLIFSIEDGVARGSGRSYGNLNLFSLVSSCADLFEKYGGHTAAVGITLSVDLLPVFRDCLCKKIAQEHIDFEAVKSDIDAFVTLQDCTLENFQELQRLAPFGHSNPIPTLALKRVFIEQRASMGKTKTHFRYVASDGISQASGICFGVDDMEEALQYENLCDVIFEPMVDEWRGRFSAKLMTKQINTYPYLLKDSCDDFTEKLLSNDASILETGDYAGISQADYFNTKVVGVSFENRQELLENLQVGTRVELLRQKDNEYDSNAIAVVLENQDQIGYLNKHLAARIAPIIDGGQEYNAEISAITGGLEQDLFTKQSYGVNIFVYKPGYKAKADLDDDTVALMHKKKQLQSLSEIELNSYLCKALIGDNSLRKAQEESLDNLQRGFSTLTIMATGRGKSLIFHLHAAKTALLQHKASIFIYPLRALVADQAYHLQDVFSSFGLVVRVLTGETDEKERTEIFEKLGTEQVDVILTTPEFLTIYAKRFAQTKHTGFLVVDEAHHIGQSRAGNRPAYMALKTALDTLGNPLVLAVTATASDDEASRICKTLHIEKLVLDPSIRNNLYIKDYRDLKTRDSYLAFVVAQGKKCIIYVNSRDKSIDLTRMLRKKLPNMAPFISFYNAGLSKTNRKLIEEKFRDGELRCIVSTSAFGEGIDIPDVEDVVLYHMPFNDIEFNQMAGRAGRNGKDAYIHLLFSHNDARINEKILNTCAPSRQNLIALYRALVQLNNESKEKGFDSFSSTNSELSQKASLNDKKCKLEDSAVSTGVAVFRELGFLTTSGHGVARRIKMASSPQQMSLDNSVRYQEGKEEIETFVHFKSWALTSTSEELLERFNRPILPLYPENLV